MLIEHQSIHTGEKSYECDVCHKKFGYRKALRVHKKRHFIGTENTGAPRIDLDGKPYSCDLCDKKFAAMKYVESHQDKVHIKKKYSTL